MNQSWTKFLPSFVRARLEGRYNLTKIIENISWLFGEHFFRMGVGLVVGIWVARYLGPEQYGQLNYALAFVGLFAPLTVLGLNGIAVRDIVRDPSSRDLTLGTTFVLKFTGSLVVLILTIAVVMFLRPDDRLTHWLVAILACGTVFKSFDFVDLWFQSQVQSKYSVWARTASLGLSSATRVVMILLGLSVIAFAFSYLLDAVLVAVGLLIAYIVDGSSFKTLKFTITRAKSLLHDSWPIIISSFAIIVQARIDQVMLGQMLGDEVVGYYSVAMRLIEVFGVIPMILTKTVAPAVTTAKKSNEADYYQKLLQVYQIMFIFFLVISVPIFFMANPIVLLLYGPEFLPAGPLLSLLAIRLFFANFGVAKGLFITNENLFRYSLVTSVVGSITNVGLNYLLIPSYGAVGAIVATMVSFTVTIFLFDPFYPKTRTNFKMMLKAMILPFAGLKALA